MRTNQIRNSDLFKLADIVGGVTKTRRIYDYIGNQGVSAAKFADSSKARILFHYFTWIVEQKHDSAGICKCVEYFFSPGNFIDAVEEFDEKRNILNVLLSLSGLELDEGGKVCDIRQAETLDEALKKAESLLAKVRERRLHRRIEACCRKDLLRDDYFDVVSEAVKGVFDRIKELSGEYSVDGSKLVDAAFGSKCSVLVINTRSTASEESEHTGLMSFLKGLYGTFRNPSAHELKVRWKKDEDEVLEILGAVSLAHRYLDRAQKPTYAMYTPPV